MRTRIKIWQDDGELETDPTWVGSEAYAQLPVLRDEAAWNAFLAARAALTEARQRVIAALGPPEPLTTEEREACREVDREEEERHARRLAVKDRDDQELLDLMYEELP